MSEFPFEVKVIDGVTVAKLLANPTLSHLKELVAHIAKGFPRERRLWDLSQIDFNVPYHDIIKLAQHKKKVFSEPCKVAFVVQDSLSYGQVNQFRAHREDENCSVMPFQSEDEAMAWLKA